MKQWWVARVTRTALVAFAMVAFAGAPFAATGLLAQDNAGEAEADVAPGADLLIYNVWVRPTAPMPDNDGADEDATPAPMGASVVTGAFMTIENMGEQDYALVAAGGSFAHMTMLHETSMHDGVMQMHHTPRIEIPAGETVRLESGGYHVMFMELMRDLYPNTAIPLMLVFEDADGMAFDITVAALVTDFPPEDDTLIAANAWAVVSDPSTAEVYLTLDNRGEEDEVLVGAANETAATTRIVGLETPTIAAGEQLQFAPDELAVRLEGLSGTLTMAFPLELQFESGKTLIVPVYVREAAAD